MKKLSRPLSKKHEAQKAKIIFRMKLDGIDPERFQALTPNEIRRLLEIGVPPLHKADWDYLGNNWTIDDLIVAIKGDYDHLSFAENALFQDVLATVENDLHRFFIRNLKAFEKRLLLKSDIKNLKHCCKLETDSFPSFIFSMQSALAKQKAEEAIARDEKARIQAMDAKAKAIEYAYVEELQDKLTGLGIDFDEDLSSRDLENLLISQYPLDTQTLDLFEDITPRPVRALILESILNQGE